jgi:hypothetical protein
VSTAFAPPCATRGWSSRDFDPIMRTSPSVTLPSRGTPSPPG